MLHHCVKVSAPLPVHSVHRLYSRRLKTHTMRPDAARSSLTLLSLNLMLLSLNLRAAKRTRVNKHYKKFDLFGNAKRLVAAIICFNYILKQQDAAKLRFDFQVCPLI